jgi:hypothetical protein
VFLRFGLFTTVQEYILRHVGDLDRHYLVKTHITGVPSVSRLLPKGETLVSICVVGHAFQIRASEFGFVCTYYRFGFLP